MEKHILAEFFINSSTSQFLNLFAGSVLDPLQDFFRFDNTMLDQAMLGY